MLFNALQEAMSCAVCREAAWSLQATNEHPNCIHQVANTNYSMSSFVSFLQPMQVEQQVENAIQTMCSEYSTALQSVQDARPLVN